MNVQQKNQTVNPHTNTQSHARTATPKQSTTHPHPTNNNTDTETVLTRDLFVLSGKRSVGVRPKLQTPQTQRKKAVNKMGCIKLPL